ncbi:Predicted transcriptional regulator, ArsR family [Propionibacterium cyclohexanicum]|uniref:Predicted transcriptional regulator, ArsR family n=1 Tax=Propionibacterium cyclohexanicum TaxID=64702 RepID=A0A1H9PLT2_9ACTN|nr:helix-turn-helix domain-containing protein [Propionibacterium cyclohexanicum]SER49050.1 Predicted transcriptional regulator, ArsR family [Propionibacterium cyclohexanicum]
MASDYGNNGVVEAVAKVPSSPDTGESSARLEVLRELMGRGRATAAELARSLGVTPTAVRRQLGMLLDAGQVEEHERRQPGPRGRGRPAREYVITASGRAVFGQGYDDLAIQAIGALVEAAGAEGVTRLGERRCDEVGTQYEERRRETPDEDPVETLAELLDQKGYVARVAPSPVGAQLCLYNCPVAEVATAYPQLCEVETRVFSRLLGSHVQRLATIAHGDGICTTNVPSHTVTFQATTPDDPGTDNHREATSA